MWVSCSWIPTFINLSAVRVLFEQECTELLLFSTENKWTDSLLSAVLSKLNLEDSVLGTNWLHRGDMVTHPVCLTKC